VQAHTLGEVRNLGTVSLRVSSGTIRPIFIKIGSYFTDKEQKISWHSFFETRCITALCVASRGKNRLFFHLLGLGSVIDHSSLCRINAAQSVRKQ